ncbi:MAG TPA: Gfo/Idh/MocA family oxidoreductase [Lacunisphaera sp.]|nr:Gfo/Idh/MocA family oxidoreductase [Lacunisphaera sp.]
MAKKLNWGIVTTGWIARKFVTDLLQSRTGRFVAVGARNQADADKFAADFGGARAHGSYEALLGDPEVEAVYIGTPHPWHAEWAIKAAAAGKHILCEKPLTLSLADTERVLDAARRHNVLLMEAYMYRFHPQTRRVVELVRSGALGKVRLIRASFNVIMDFSPEHRMFKKSLGGGTILDLGCYPVTYSRHIAGAVHGKDFVEPEEFHGTGHVRPEVGTDDFATAVATFPGGILAQLSCGATVVNDNSVQIHGTDGWLDVPNPFVPGLLGQDEKIILHRRAGAAEEIVIRSPGVGLYAHEADAFAEALARGAREVPLATWADTLGTARLLDCWLAGAGVKY